MDDPWTWLLSRAPSGAWRHVSYDAPAPGAGQDPTREPRVEVIHRLIAYPEPAFAAVVAAVARAESPQREARWLCYRQPGQEPTRPYWLCFVSPEGAGRRFHLGLELCDRNQLGLWFFSGYDAGAVSPALSRPFPNNPELRLPCLNLTRQAPQQARVEAWVAAAWQDALAFVEPDELPPTPHRTGGTHAADQSRVIEQALVGLADDASFQLVGLRASRARLLAFPEGRDVEVHPVARLVTTVGRDPHCEVVLDDRRVSAEHLRITWRHGEPELEDLGSKNGTTVGGTPATPGRPLPLGGEVVLDLGGLTCLWVRDTEGGLAAQQQRLKDLVRSGKLGEADVELAVERGTQRGITPVEHLLASRRLALRDWLGSGGCLGLMLVLATCLLWLVSGAAAVM